MRTTPIDFNVQALEPLSLNGPSAIEERDLPREALYSADEAFMTGTAAEITPIRSVDRKRVGAGVPGPVTQALQRAFFGLFDGTTRDEWGWLDYVDPPAAQDRSPVHASAERVSRTESFQEAAA